MLHFLKVFFLSICIYNKEHCKEKIYTSASLDLWLHRYEKGRKDGVRAKRETSGKFVHSKPADWRASKNKGKCVTETAEHANFGRVVSFR